MDPIINTLGRRATRDLAHSALPGAPVVPERSHRPHRARGQETREHLAAALHAVARWVEPRCSTAPEARHARTA